MKIAIIGAGSIGLLFAGYLGKKHAVTIIPRREEQCAQLEKEGISIVMEGNKCFKTIVKSNIGYESLNEQDLVIVAVKQYHLPNIKPILVDLKHTIPLLFLQNGMGHIEILKDLNSKTILVGTVEHGALKVNDYTVKHNGIGQTNIAMYKGESSIIDSLVSYNIASFPFCQQYNWEKMLVKKLMINAIINPLTAVLKIKNGQLITNSFYLSLLKEYFLELFSVFSFMDKQLVFEEILKICRNTSENKSSMLNDILHNRKTEIDAILGYILERAKSQKIQLPITKILFQMVKGMEGGSGE
ncbi:2-dehydropantoate 2-reductase [Heyndrickxia camelliae]|uniref:2-dehydropantoate 2-reductase n=1 Tax=Heyndrickxia camelliae TaxID=1707093 RepID=A0A2N3LQP6_9BACI|nr:2-dehydropantoate 2-reductase [Heyndrickxia camelliae]PKR86956.1 2-dehydropantoate 2-reductase [Heyndrickxia camelliae]